MNTPMTLTFFDTTLWRLLVRVAPEIDLNRHQLTPELAALLNAVNAPTAPFGDFERMWAGFTVVGRALSASPDLTDPELLVVAITELRQVLLTGQADNEEDTADGQAMLLTLSIGLLAASVFGSSAAAEIMELRDVAGKALRAKAGRSDHAKALNANRTAWHVPALARAVELRDRYPYRSDAKIADVIVADAKVSPAPPSTQALVEAMATWRREGVLKQRRRAGE